VKYNAAGAEQWAARLAGPGNSIPTAIVADAAGNVYVTGGSESTGTGYDFLTVKYNAAGIEQWRDRYSYEDNGEDWSLSICLDSSGNVAVCGYVTDLTSYHDWAVIGYTPSGTRRFVTPRTSSGGNPDEANCIAADPDGNYYVAGRLWFEGHVDDAAVVKYNAGGGEQWTASYDGPRSGDGAVAISRSASGDLYATGWSTGIDDNADVLTMKVSPAGAVVWTARYAAPENGNDLGTRVAVDAAGNVRVLGRVQVGPGGDYDLVVLGYAADSTQQFANRLNSGGSCTPGGLALDRDGHVLVSGAFTSDYITLEFDGPNEVWRRVENFGSGDAATAVGVDDSGYVYVTGRGDGGALAWDFVTIKYSRRDAVAEQRQTSRRSELPTTIVRGALWLPRKSGTVPARLGTVPIFALLDISGRKVLNLHPGANDVSRFSPGVYFVSERLAASGKGSAAAVRKVVLTP
jgi:hypothetical protein